MTNYSIHQQGSTLVEALITVSMVGIGALSLVNLQTKLIRSNNTTFQNAQAMIIARNKMEHLRAYSTLSQYKNIMTGEDKTQGIATVFLRSWAVSEYSNPNYKDVEIEVSWNKSDGTKGSINIRSKIALSEVTLSGNLMNKSSPINDNDNDDGDGNDNNDGNGNDNDDGDGNDNNDGNGNDNDDGNGNDNDDGNGNDNNDGNGNDNDDGDGNDNDDGNGNDNDDGDGNDNNDSNGNDNDDGDGNDNDDGDGNDNDDGDGKWQWK